jgi:hypothetical protein
MHIPKKGLRSLGIAESYTGRTNSTLCGVVMRKDLQLDGCAFATATVGGMDATEAIHTIIQDLNRQDINVIMLSGSVISWFNVIDPDAVFTKTGIPVICVTYEESEGLDADICNHFPTDNERLAAYRKLGSRTQFSLNGGLTIYLRSWGIDIRDAGMLVAAFTCSGKIPEPLRVARLCARAAHHFCSESIIP